MNIENTIQHDFSADKQYDLREIMLENSPCISIIFSSEMKAIDCNETAVNYLGYENKAELLENIWHDINSSIPAFQPDASPTIPLTTRMKYVVEHGSHDFEMELILKNSRVPIRFMLRRVDVGDNFLIACYAMDTQALKEARNELLRHDFLMRQVNRAATRLLSVEPEKFNTVIDRTLKSLTQAVGACQMAILENFEKNDKTGCRMLYNWDTKGTSFADDIENDGYTIDYTDVFDWYQALANNKRVNDSGTKLSQLGREKYFPRGTKAFMIIPVFFQKRFWGIIVVAKSSDDHLFTNAEERAIQSGGILTVAAIIRNQITQNLIAAREAALASEQAKGTFLSRMSHEIRTPLNAILGMTTIAQKTDDVENIKYSLQKIEIASNQLLNLVNDILDMSKIETGKLEVMYQPFDFMMMLQRVIDIQRVGMDEKGQTFTLECSKPFARMIVTDELRLSQVFINLLSNAVKFTADRGNISLHVDYDEADCNGKNLLKVEVCDDGIGIADEQQKRLFKSFEQADGSITRRFGGSGLGLAICKNIVQLLGGKIHVESSEGKGSSFIFEIEFTWDGEIDSTNDIVLDDEVCRLEWADRNILLAEDIDINREIVLALLSETKVNVTCAENGKQAFELFAQEPDKYSLILMDIQMPIMDGYEATRRIRALGFEKAQEIPILAMTANAFSSDVQLCIDAGMNGHISKPIDIEVLFSRLSTYLSNE